MENRSLAEQKARRPIKERLRELKERLEKRMESDCVENQNGSSAPDGTEEQEAVPEDTLVGSLSRQLEQARGVQDETGRYRGTPSKPDRTGTNVRQILSMLDQLLSSLGGPSSAPPSSTTRSDNPSSEDRQRVNLATSQEWAALALSAARDAEAGDVFGVLDLMQVRVLIAKTSSAAVADANSLLYDS